MTVQVTSQIQISFQNRIAELYGQSWFQAPPPIESERIRDLAARGMQSPPRLSASEIQELASAVAAFHNRKALRQTAA